MKVKPRRNSHRYRRYSRYRTYRCLICGDKFPAQEWEPHTAPMRACIQIGSAEVDVCKQCSPFLRSGLIEVENYMGRWRYSTLPTLTYLSERGLEIVETFKDAWRRGEAYRKALENKEEREGKHAAE